MYKLNNVAEFLRVRMAATGRDAATLAELSRGVDKSIYELASTGEGAVPLQHIAEMAKALNADPLELLRHLLHDCAPDTYSAVAERFDDALTLDELAVVQSMRRAIGGPYLMSQTPLQIKSMHEWLDSLRRFNSGLH
jgi:hypothetical protein